MDTSGYDNQDPNAPDYLAQIRQRVLQGFLPADDPAAPMAETAASVDPSTPSPDYVREPSAPSAGVNTPVFTAASQTETNPTPTPAPAAAANTDPLSAWNQPSAAGVGTPGNATNAINGYYSQFLGRTPENDAVVQAWLNSGLDLGGIQNAIANSAEAKSYAERQGRTMAASTPAATPAVAGSASSVISTGGGAQSTAFNDQIRSMILDFLKKAGQPVDENDPQIQATLSAARDEAQRSQTQERNALAERLYAQNATGGGGLNTNALTSQIQQSSERNAGALAGLRASVLTSVYNSRVGQLQNLLQLAMQSGDAESARTLQAQIANLQAAVQREGLGVNLAEFGAQLDQNSVLAGLR